MNNTIYDGRNDDDELKSDIAILEMDLESMRLDIEEIKKANHKAAAKLREPFAERIVRETK